MENGHCLPDYDTDLDESGLELGSFDKRLDLDNLDLNKQRLNNKPRTPLVQWNVTPQPAGSGQNELIYPIVANIRSRDKKTKL